MTDKEWFDFHYGCLHGDGWSDKVGSAEYQRVYQEWIDAGRPYKGLPNWIRSKANTQLNGHGA